MRPAQGLTLVELLVAAALAALLSLAMATSYADSRRHHVYQEEVARMQENGQHALRLLTRDLALAGFYAGLPGAPPAPPSIAVDCASLPWALAADAPLDLVNDWPGGATPVTVTGQSLRCLAADRLLPGSDLLALRRTGGVPAQFLGTPAAAQAPSTVWSWYLRVEDGAPVRWEQLRARDIVAGAHSAAGLSLWPASARIYAAQRGAGGIPALCAETLAGNRMVSRCLVEGVEQLQVEYGLDLNKDGIAERFVDAPDPDELPRVVAARVHLLLRSIRPIAGHSDRHPHALGAKSVPAGNDGYLRRVLSQTVALDRVVQRLASAG